MNKSFAIIVIFSVIIMSSCQKEIDWGTTTGSSAVNQKLVKITSKTGTDSTVITYTYDNQNRLIKESTVGVTGGTVIDNALTINRNATGVILNTVQKSPALVTAGIDSVLTRFNYNSTSAIYTSSIFSLTAFGFTVTDSAVYSYDASGKIISDLHFLKTGILPPIQSLKNQYTYSPNGLNLTSLDQLASTTPGGPLSPVASQVYNFDSKINPLIIKNEAVLLARTGLFNANNGTKLVVTSTASPATNFTMDYVYKYNSSNKPDSSYGTRTPGGAVTSTKYFYQ